MGRGCTMAHGVHEMRWGLARWFWPWPLCMPACKVGPTHLDLHLPLQHPACTATATLQGTGLHPSRLRDSLIQDAGKALVQLASFMLLQLQRWRQAAAAAGGVAMQCKVRHTVSCCG